MIEKNAVTTIAINSLIASRWSGRAFDPDAGVSEEHMMTILEAARWAPSCFGDEPWRYIVCNKQSDLQGWQNALDCLVEGNQQWAQHVPVLILVLADTLFSSNGNENRWGEYDTGAASISMCLQAKELGLMTHQMGGIIADKAKEIFSVPERFTAMAMMSIGYQLDKDSIPENMLERELVERKRKPFNELFFAGTWGQSFS
jgi:nitroreductase